MNWTDLRIRLPNFLLDETIWSSKCHQTNQLLLCEPGSSPHPIREGVKQQLLYCRVGIGYHLQILANGSVGGVHKPTENCWLKVFAMKHGVVGIKGVKSGLYLCMSGEGLTYGAEKFSDDCLLKENLEENHYTTYSSLSHPGVYLALSHKGELRKGNSVGRHQSCTHFLPRRTP
ncbi:Fibroblast growth factor 4 [Collichthys lucidus]|uniref:Fibroblast growth factor n=1 Tax=Collichthys lucidus TaxID=240159 RepID=A0A4V6AM40_COLLU|nr:Fibroblast growth factor 4 [Collichthys lucidus]